LWERWKNPTGEWIKTCAILTTEANSVTLQLHVRMPVILNPDDYDLWLDPGMTDTASASDTRRALNEPLSGQHTHQ